MSRSQHFALTPDPSPEGRGEKDFELASGLFSGPQPSAFSPPPLNESSHDA